jgi:hypothetical protein
MMLLAMLLMGLGVSLLIVVAPMVWDYIKYDWRRDRQDR